LALAPLVALGVRAATDALGAEPVETLLHETGQWALRLLLASLAVTPARRWLGLPALAPLRRSFGLLALLYAGLHFGVYLGLEVGLDPGLLVEDVTERPYVTAGFGALLLLPLGITSTRGWQRRLGRRWVRLHRLVYVAAGLAVLHFLWLVKADLREPLIYASVLGVLLLARLPRLPRPAGRRRPRPAPLTRGSRPDSL
ncbi:MAG: protein-methionine-sulfoxide reductase heme-binding subunit MsrQ, partial [Myxococcota bacterium]|nr:protein-methionine-sulfoxide reductase heme-binding subunit MsrQ [Myxococcota bacterium]